VPIVLFWCWKFFAISLVSCFVICDSLLLSQNMSGMTDQVQIWMPLIWVVSIALIVRAIYPEQPPVWLRLILTIGAMSLNLRYLHWRITATLMLDWYNGIASVGLVLMESIAILNTSFVICQTIRRTNHSPEADRLSIAVRSGDYAPSVDIFVATYDEPTCILRPTLVGCRAMAYPNKTIWLLDDGGRPEAEELALELGCRYLSRPAPRKHAKAGNLASGLAASEGEIIVTFDADFIPLNHFLERALGFFINPNLAMIVTPQNFYNPDPPEINLGGLVLPHEQTTFYDIIQPGRDTMNSVICTGTSILFRRSALDAVGGFPTDTIVEDWVTGMKLQSSGFRTMYLNELLSLGAAPGDLSAYLIQRIRWAEGTLKTLLGPYSPLWMPGMTFLQRLNHFSGIWYWIDQGIQSFAYFAPILYLLFGMQAIDTSLPDIIRFWVPNYVAGLIIVSWSMGARTIVVSFAYNVLQCFHLLPVIYNSFLRPNQKVKFKTTPKEWWKGELDYSLLTPLFILLGLNICTIISGFIQFDSMSRSGGSQVINLIWAQFNALILVLGILSCCGVTRERNAPRIKLTEFCHISLVEDPDRAFDSRIIDISETGLAFAPITALALKPGDKLDVTIPAESLVLTATVIRLGDRIGCHFEEMSSDTLNQLLEFIFCRPYHWSKPIVANEWDSFVAIGRSVFDLYPIQRMLNYQQQQKTDLAEQRRW
jgi:cellulose synthase (UDP-forming)